MNFKDFSRLSQLIKIHFTENMGGLYGLAVLHTVILEMNSFK